MPGRPEGALSHRRFSFAVTAKPVAIRSNKINAAILRAPLWLPAISPSWGEIN